MSAGHERALALVARRQHALMSERTLVEVTGRADELRRRIRSGRWRAVLPGVIAPAGLELDRELVEAAAMMWAPAGGLSHLSAARRDGLWVPESDRVWLTVPFEDGHRSRPGVVVVRTRHPAPLRTDGFLRWTAAPRTIVDLAQVLDERTLSAVLLSAVRKKLATAAQVADAAAPLPGRAGLAVLSRVVGLWAPARESLLEDALYADAVAAGPGLTVTRQVEVRSETGALAGRADVAVPELRLAFEADGLLFHSTDEQIAADQRRDRAFLAIGWQTARFREGAFEDRDVVRRDLRAILGARSRQLRVA